MSPRRDAVPCRDDIPLCCIFSIRFEQKLFGKITCNHFVCFGEENVSIIWHVARAVLLPSPSFFYDILSRQPPPPPPCHCVSKFCFGWYLKISRLAREMDSFEFMRVLFFTFWFWANVFSEENHNGPMIHNLSSLRWSFWECSECFCRLFMCLIWFLG